MTAIMSRRKFLLLLFYIMKRIHSVVRSCVAQTSPSLSTIVLVVARVHIIVVGFANAFAIRFGSAMLVSSKMTLLCDCAIKWQVLWDFKVWG